MLNAYKMLFDLMVPAERRRFAMVTAATFVFAAFEALSVIAILPFLQLLSKPELVETNAWLARIYDLGGFSSPRQFVVATGIAVFAITVMGLITKMATVWIVTRFALMRAYSISARLLTGYLGQPYEWFLSRHTADLGATVLSEVDRMVSEVLLPALRIIPEMFSATLIVLVLCLLEPWIALGGAALIGGAYAAVYLVARRKLLQVGQQRMVANRARFHIVQEATGGVKELKLMGLEESFLLRFRDEAFRLANTQTTAQVVLNTPRFALEGVAFGGMILLILVLLARGNGDVATLVPTLGLMAAAGLRLFPALQQLYHRASSVRNGMPMLERIHGDMMGMPAADLSADLSDADMRPHSVPAPPLNRALELHSVRYGYPGTDRAALRGLDLVIQANTTVGIVGGTGAGKTTLVDVILGLLHPQEGALVTDGRPIENAEDRRAWQASLGYVPQTIFLTDGTVAQNIAFGVPAGDIDMAAVERAARIASLHDFVVTELPEGYDTSVGERGVRLSGGQRQRIGIARALYRDPAVLILDEATSALDTLTERAVMDAVHKIAGKKTIIMIAHRLTTVQECDRIFLLRDGQVAASGRFDDLIEADDQFRLMATGS